MTHRPNGLRRAVLTLAATLLACAAWTSAGEGMWTFDNPPAKILKEKYGFDATPQWLEHVRLSSVRFNDGGSGSFVSADGLVLTNHHVARGQIQKLSTKEKDYVTDGFLAKTRAGELKCPDLELNVLVSMENVTAKVMAAAKPGMSPAAANDAKKAAIAAIEKESMEKTGLRSDVVGLYNGGEYWLYGYKKYTDVRLVFAPEEAIAFYGGDPDNFTFPRYDLDMTIFRVYENGVPVKPQHYLKWNAQGAAAGELVFVSGHPGKTNRLNTLAQLELQRDDLLPLRLELLRKMLATARKYAAQGPEQARQALGLIFGLENSIKSQNGEYEGLKNPLLMAVKAKEEAEFRRLVDANPEWKKLYADAWTALEKTQAIQKAKAKGIIFHAMPRTAMSGYALSLVRLATELPKANADRLDGFHDAELPSLKFRLMSPAPTYPAFEEALVAFTLREALNQLGPDDVFVKEALQGKTPEEQAKALMSATKLGDPAFRKQLLEGGAKAVDACTDPLVLFAKRLDPILRAEKKQLEDEVESVERVAGEKIGAARFAVYGKNAYPDATFTLRLSYGVVKGYPMNGTLAPSKTTFYGLFDRAESFDNKDPFTLPEKYAEKRAAINLATPFNFVCSCDIIGGNSGSPVVNRAGELVGLVFDGNIESLVGRFIFDETANRTVSVHSAGIIEALTKVYEAGDLVKELLNN